MNSFGRPDSNAMRAIVFAVGMTGAVIFSNQNSNAQTTRATTDEGVPAYLVVKGQHAACTGDSHKTFNIEMKETKIRLSDDIQSVAWTFNGTVPGPVLEACVGDLVTLMLTNHGSMARSSSSRCLKPALICWSITIISATWQPVSFSPLP